MNEVLFYGGIGAAAFGTLYMIISVMIFFYKKAKLNLSFDKEYGKNSSINNIVEKW